MFRQTTQQQRSLRRTQLVLIGTAALGLVLVGILLAHQLNLAACPLCILQRMLYLVIALSASIAYFLAHHTKSSRLAILLMGLAAFTGAGIAAYQTWLQRFAADTNCAANQPWWERFVYWAGEKAPWFFEATGLCSDAGWKFLGLSIAEWSLLAFSLFTFLTLRLLLKKPN